MVSSMDEETRKEIQEWLKYNGEELESYVEEFHNRTVKGVELILRVLLEKEKL